MTRDMFVIIRTRMSLSVILDDEGSIKADTAFAQHDHSLVLLFHSFDFAFSLLLLVFGCGGRLTALVALVLS